VESSIAFSRSKWNTRIGEKKRDLGKREREEVRRAAKKAPLDKKSIFGRGQPAHIQRRGMRGPIKNLLPFIPAKAPQFAEAVPPHRQGNHSLSSERDFSLFRKDAADMGKRIG